MKLYVFMVAPNPTKVRLYLAEKTSRGCEIDLEQVPVSLIEGEQRQPEHLARNPLGNLPVLEFDDGSFLTESLAIIHYIEELHPEPPMIGKTPLERAQVRRLEQIAHNSVLAAVGRLFHATKAPLPGATPNAELVPSPLHAGRSAS